MVLPIDDFVVDTFVQIANADAVSDRTSRGQFLHTHQTLAASCIIIWTTYRFSRGFDAGEDMVREIKEPGRFIDLGGNLEGGFR